MTLDASTDTPTQRWPVTILTTSLVTGIFILDLVIPTGVLVPVLYTIPMLIALRFLPPQAVAVMAGLSALFTVLGLVLSPPGETAWMVYSNRALAVATIAGMSLLYALHRQTATQLSALQQLLPQCASCKKVRDDVGYWSQLELYLEEHRIQQFTQGLCPVCERRYKLELLALKAARNQDPGSTAAQPATPSSM